MDRLRASNFAVEDLRFVSSNMDRLGFRVWGSNMDRFLQDLSVKSFRIED